MERGNGVMKWQLRSALMAALLLAGSVATAAELEWISLDGSEEDTHAELFLEEDTSNPGQTWMKLVIHGFWLEEKESPQGDRYHKVTVPGMGSLNEAGAPDLPAWKGRLGIVTTAQQINFVEYVALEERIFDSFFDIWPQVHEETEPIEGNVPERFVINEDLYATNRDWPLVKAAVDADFGHLNGLDTAGFELTPFQWNPVSGVMTVAQTLRVVIDHSGEILQPGPFTRDRVAYFGSILVNMDEIDDIMLLGWWHYDADYLIIAHSAYWDELDDFMDLKRSQGYHVSQRNLEEIGSNCDLIRAAIADWYDDAPDSRDKYCLLVGDTDQIPFCTSPYLNIDYPSGVNTDDLYGSVNGDDLDEEVYVGRLSIDNSTDLRQQLDRIIAYQTGGHLNQDYSKVALVAHRENAPGKYTEAHESVRTAFYNDPPVFVTFYGYLGATNEQVSAGIDAGFGLVAYRGHGSVGYWSSWNTSYQSYDEDDIMSLTNSIHPVVWSFSCTNSALQWDDCVAEEWMEQGDYGAISHYGSTVASYTSINHELDRQMFRAVYHSGLNIQGPAIQYGEVRTGILNSYTNNWMYLLLGDPSMRIRTHGALAFGYALPDYIVLDPTNPFDLVLDIHENGEAFEGVLFAVWKPGDDRQQDEVFDNTYSDENGQAVLTIQPETEGWLYYTLRDGLGRAVYDSIEVRSGSTDVPDMDSPGLRFWAEPSIVNDGSTLRLSRGLARNAEIEIFEVSGRRVRRIEMAAEQVSAVWDGRNDQGRRVGGGVYLARIRESGRVHRTRLVVLN